MSEQRRRVIEFDSFATVVEEAESLLAGGYQKLGKWDLAQACDHLAAWMSFSIEGFPKPNVAMRALLFLLRKTVGRRELARALESGQLSSAAPTFRSTVLPSGRDAAGAIKRLRRMASRFEGHTGLLYDSPLYGKLTYEQWRSLHLVHCAHHLSFLLPNRPAS